MRCMIVIPLCLWGACFPAGANEVERSPGGRIQPPATLTSKPVGRGYLVAGGEYIAPPYTVEVRGKEVLVNGRELGADFDTAGPAGDHGYRGSAAADRAADVEGWLSEGCLLLVHRNRLVWVAAHSQVHRLLLTLGADLDLASKLSQIETDTGVPVNRELWTPIIRAHLTSEALRRRLHEEISAPAASPAESKGSSAGLMYSLNVGGMALVVLAFGTLLGHQPPRSCDCHTCAACGNGSSFLLRNVALIVLLSAFDLGCTLLGTANGTMTELNPMAGAVIHSPVALSAFKLTATLGGAGILIWLRRHRPAQVASWWICLLCSLLVFRWVSFNSLFMA